MGMFDYVRCDYPLPVEGANALQYQTKDTPAQYLDNYVITDLGQLFHEAYDIEDRSDQNAEGLKRFRGCMTRVNKRLEPIELTGEIRFYSSFDKNWSGWIEFSAYFVAGVLKELHLIENRAAPGSEG